MKTVSIFSMLLLLLSVALARADEKAVHPDDEKEVVAVVRGTAARFLDLLRREKWDEAAEFVVTAVGKKDAVTRERMGIPKDASPEIVHQRTVEWLERLYETVKPGGVQNVRLDVRDKGLALVSYKHEDLDGFNMRQIDGQWYYTLDHKPETD